MSDWFRNTNWNEGIEEDFNRRLARARKSNRSQYLRIQAVTLVELRPEVALKLIDRYFESPDSFEVSAHETRAHALTILNRLDEAVSAFEMALAAEHTRPNVKGQARFQLPLLVATYEMEKYYDRALALLHDHPRFVFPVDRFRWWASLALIAHASNDADTRREGAEKALDAAGQRRSGFSRHPEVGLVGERYDSLVKKLRTFLNETK